MKIKLSLLLILLIPTLSFSQTFVNEEIKMSATYSAEDSDLRDILSFEKIDYFKINFTGKKLIGKNYSLIVKEIWDGNITNSDTLINTSIDERLNRLSNDTLSFKIVGKKTLQGQLKLLLIFQKFRITKEYKATLSNDYSLRVIGDKMRIEPNKLFYALAYILPYEKDGWKYWCAVDSSGEECEKWGKEFGIKHYLVFEMKFE